jgi:hypothetical protein
MENGAVRMRCFWFCIVALLTTPALAQSERDSGDGYGRRSRGEFPDSRSRGEDHEPRLRGHSRHHRNSLLSQRIVQPSRQGPAPTGFWYRCDAPAGYYPYILTCQTPWRIVPSTPYR